MALRYRMHRKEDEPELIRLWSEHSGWDRLNAESWARRFLEPPVGEACIVVATDDRDREILAQLVFFPSIVSVDGEPVLALRPFAPIVGPGARTSTLGFVARPLEHPVVAMYRHAVATLRPRGYRLAYMIPDPGWQRLFRLFPFLQCGSFPLWSLPVPLNAPLALPAGYAAGEPGSWGERFDRLWERSARLHGCSVVRDRRTLPWKVGNGDYVLTEVKRGEEPVGFVASRAKGDRQWLICDVLADDAGDSLRAVLAAACNTAHARSASAPAERPIRKVAVLATPAMLPAVETLGFTRDDYDFPLVVHRLDRSIPKQAVAPERWYLSAND